MWYHYTPTKMAKVKRHSNTKCCKECGTTGIFMLLVWIYKTQNRQNLLIMLEIRIWLSLGEGGRIKTGKEHSWKGWEPFGCSFIPGTIYFLIYMVNIQLCSLCDVSSSCILKTWPYPCIYTSKIKSLFKKSTQVLRTREL